MQKLKNNQIFILAIAILLLAFSIFISSGNGRFAHTELGSRSAVVDTKTGEMFAWSRSTGWMRIRPELKRQGIKDYKF